MLLSVLFHIRKFPFSITKTARAALLTGRLPIRNGFYTTNAHARNGKCHGGLRIQNLFEMDFC